MLYIKHQHYNRGDQQTAAAYKTDNLYGGYLSVIKNHRQFGGYFIFNRLNIQIKVQEHCTYKYGTAGNNRKSDEF